MSSRTGSALLVVGAAFVAAACGGGGGGGGSSAAPAGMREVHFDTRDGIVLDGHVAGHSSRWVILSHMYPADQSSWYGFAQRLAGDGLTALTYDFRGYGASRGSRQIERIDRDVVAAAGYAFSQGATHVDLVGASMGGTASVIAAAELPPSQRPVVVVTLSAPMSFMGLDASAAAQTLSVSMYCLAGARDNGGAQAADARRLCDGPGRTVLIADTPAHGTALITDPAALPLVDEVVRDLQLQG